MSSLCTNSVANCFGTEKMTRKSKEKKIGMTAVEQNPEANKTQYKTRRLDERERHIDTSGHF